MKHTLILWCLGCLAFISEAHPGVGIVKDSRGNIYYTDLKKVWKLTPTGARTIVVDRVHTHELYMDPQDNLHGENMWYNGEKLNTWGSYAWCLRNNGQLDTVLGPKEGFLVNYSFNRDAKGNHYWAERGKISRIKKKSADGSIIVLAEKAFKDIRWMHVTPEGIIYFIDLTDLYKIDTGGKLSLVVKELARSGPNSRHNIFGIWTDKSRNVYAAIFSEKRVKRISPEGKVTSLVYSVKPWAPTGGVFDDQGNLWLMECNIINEIRVRKIPAARLESQPGKMMAVVVNTVLTISLVACFTLLASFGLRWWISKNPLSHS